MRSFLTANDRAFRKVKILGGATTRAVIQPASGTPMINDQFMTPKQVMRVRRDSLIRAGQVVTVDGDHFLVGDLSSVGDWRSYVLFHCDRQIDWQRATTATDPTTGLDMSAGATAPTVGQPWVYWERVLRAPYDSDTRLPNIDYILATGEDVQPKDLIGGRSIIRYDRALGLLILGVKE